MVRLANKAKRAGNHSASNKRSQHDSNLPPMAGMVPNANPYFLPAYYGTGCGPTFWTGSMLKFHLPAAVVNAKLASTSQAAHPTSTPAKQPPAPTPAVSVELVGTTPAASGAKYAFKAVLTDPLSAQWSAPTTVHFTGRFSQFKTMFKQLKAEGMAGPGCDFPMHVTDHLRNMATDPHNVSRRAEELQKFWSAIMSSSSVRERSATFERITGFATPGTVTHAQLYAAAEPSAKTEASLPAIPEAEESRDAHGIDGVDEEIGLSSCMSPEGGSPQSFQQLPRKGSSASGPVLKGWVGAQRASPDRWQINCRNARPARQLQRARSL